MTPALKQLLARDLIPAVERTEDVVEPALPAEAAQRCDETADHSAHQVHRAARRASDLLDETALCIRRQPLKAVSVSFASGVVLGALLGGLAVLAPAALKRSV